MAIDVRFKTTGKVKQTSLAFRVPLTAKMCRLSMQIYRDPNVMTKGISSRCKDGRHVLFFDYDNQELKQTIDEIRYLQKHFKLSHAYVFELDRKNSYHVIILDKFPMSKAYRILRESNVDWAYRESVKMARGREWVLRSTEKGKRARPKWVGTVLSKYDKHTISSAHKKFLEVYYLIPSNKYKKADNILEIATIDYSTGNRV